MVSNSMRKIIEEEISLLFSQNTVKDLCKQDCSEFRRGEISGQISILNKILARLKNDIREKNDSAINR